MEAAIASLQAGEEQEFLRNSGTALKILQNILNEPSEDKYRRVRSASKFCSKAGVPELLQALGFELRADYYVLDEAFIPSLLSKKGEIQSARQKASSVLGWDVPFSSLKFSVALGSCKYGEVFRGMMDKQEVAVKTLKPDGGEVARESFDRELNLLYKLSHPNLVQLQAVTVTSDPASIILEFIPTSMLDHLHRTDISDVETLNFALQVAGAMDYLHSQNILHCDLGARNVRITTGRVAKLCDLGLARQDGSLTCHLPPSREGTLAVRWMAPEVLREHLFTRHADVWSFGVFLYELVTSGSVPYASFSNQEVRNKVQEGYRPPQPHNCCDEFYSLMLHCWSPRATDRPPFHGIVQTHLEPLKAKISEGSLSRQSSTSDDIMDGKSSTLKSSRSSKSKVKELSYSQVVGKGGGLLRVYTALISPFHHRVVVVCGRKTTVAEVVQVALAKCGKPELDYKTHSIAVVSPQSSDDPAHYLNPEDRIMPIKGEAAADAMFVLCIHSPGPAILEIVNTIRQNPAYSTAFDSCTRGYLVTREEGDGGGKQKHGDQRCWCVLDGSSLICYRDEEDEGVKQFERFVDFKNCSVSPLSGKKSTLVRVGTADRGQFIFAASDKAEVLQWIEAIETASHLEPSTMLLHASGGVVMQTGFLECQEFALDVGGVSPLQSMLNRRLGMCSDFTGSYSAIDYGKHWTVLKSSGLLQCLVRGRPETLFSLLNAKKVKVHNPKEMREGVDYYIEIECESSKIVLKAECPSDHFDWVLAMERVLREKGLQGRLCGDRGKESGYVTLKRLMTIGEGGVMGWGSGSPMQLYAMPRCFSHMDDVYEPPRTALPPQKSPPRDQKHTELAYENQSPPPPPLPATYINFVPPPPLPPRSVAGPPPLPPKGTPISPPPPFPNQNGSNSSSPPDPDGDYIIMQPQSLPSTPSGGPPSTLPSPLRSVPSTPNGAHPRIGSIPSQPITIPNRRPGKQSKLLQSDDSLSSSSQTIDSSLPDTHDWTSPSGHSHHSMSDNHSLPRHSSSQSLSSHHRQTSGNLNNSLSSLHRHPAQNGDRSSGYNSPLLSMSPSPGIRRSQSNRFVRQEILHTLPDDVSQSDGMVVAEAKSVGSHHPVSQAGSVPLSCESGGYCSNRSSAEDFAKLPPGWRKGYCNSKVFFTNTETGVTTWSIEDVFADYQKQQEKHPGGRWQVVTMEDGQVYYYHEVTRQTTWNVQDTFS